MIWKYFGVVALLITIGGCGGKSGGKSDPYMGTWRMSCVLAKNAFIVGESFKDLSSPVELWIDETVSISKSKITFDTVYFSDSECKVKNAYLSDMVEMMGIERLSGSIKKRTELASSQGYSIVSYSVHLDMFDSTGPISFYKVDDRLYRVEYDWASESEWESPNRYRVNFDLYYDRL